MSDVEAFDREWKTGDRGKAKEMAREYVVANKAVLTKLLGSYTLEGLVDLVTAYRMAGREEDRIITDMWLLSEYPPQNIVASFVVGSAVDAAMEILMNQERSR